MLSIFERSVFRQFVVINAIYFCVIMGLYTIIDLFDNVDDFVNNAGGEGTLMVGVKIATHYGRVGLFIFDAASIPMIAISILTILLLLKRKGQIKPFLSAGIPAYRILVPALLCGVCTMVGLKTLNREMLLGNAVHHLHAARGKAETLHQVVPRYDHASQILINGWTVFPESNRVEGADFLLPPEIAGSEMVFLKADEATFYERQGERPSGWLLKQAEPPLAQIPLTELGLKFVKHSTTSGNVFVVSDVGPDLIYKAKESSAFLTTEQLITRIKSPAIDTNTARSLEFSLHSRVVEPMLTALMVGICIPVVLQRESRGMIFAASKCGFWLFLIIGSTYAVRFISDSQIVEPVQAAWLPLFFVTPMTVWMLDLVET